MEYLGVVSCHVVCSPNYSEMSYGFFTSNNQKMCAEFAHLCFRLLFSFFSLFLPLGRRSSCISREQ